MSSIEEVRVTIIQANDRLSESLGQLQAAFSNIEQAQGLFLQASEGSSQSDVREAAGMLAAAREQIGDGQRYVGAAITSSESVATRL